MTDDLALSGNNQANHRPRPVVLLFLDGWGIDLHGEVNAINIAQPKNFLNLVKQYPVALLKDDSRDRRRRYWSLGTGLALDSDQYPSQPLCLAKILADNNLSQLKISPAHSFIYLNLLFNAYQEEAFPGEERIIIGLGDDNYLDDLKETVKVADQAIQAGAHDLIVLSLPLADQLSVNCDFPEIVKGIKVLDNYINKITATVLAEDGVLMIVAPFGNAEYTKDLAADWLNREPSNNPVPVILIAKQYLGKTIGLADPLDDDLNLLSPVGGLNLVLPTVLKIMAIDLPPGIATKSLI